MQVLYELCRHMRYRKLNGDSLLTLKRDPCASFFIVMSGTAHAYTAEPKFSRADRRRLLIQQTIEPPPAAQTERQGQQQQQQRQQPAAAPAPAMGEIAPASYLATFKGVKPAQVLREGDAVCETELLDEMPTCATTVVTTEPVG